MEKIKTSIKAGVSVDIKDSCKDVGPALTFYGALYAGYCLNESDKWQYSALVFPYMVVAMC